MNTINCPQCRLTQWATTLACQRCGYDLDDRRKADFVRRQRSETDEIALDEPELTGAELKRAALKKIVWGGGIAFFTIALLFVAALSGFFTDDPRFNKVKIFSVITIFPLGAAVSGLIELATGLSIFTIIRKWGELPSWLAWLIGIVVFLLVLVVILGGALIVVLNFF
ncbi:MAG: hypothetical protein JSS81_26270 [Acidobacteria bacterium]|nr:hypothetical protein [Acidobacteriota bacterium]